MTDRQLSYQVHQVVLTWSMQRELEKLTSGQAFVRRLWLWQKPTASLRLGPPTLGISQPL